MKIKIIESGVFTDSKLDKNALNTINGAGAWCGANACGADICVLELCIVDACGAEACGLNLISVCPAFVSL